MLKNKNFNIKQKNIKKYYICPQIFQKKSKMKKIILFGALLSLNVAFSQDKPFAFSQFPKNSQEFINQNFKGETITASFQETDFFSKEYKVILSDGTRVEFNDKGEWTEIKTFNKGIAESLIPSKIGSYVATNFQNAMVKELKKNKKGFSVELANDIELEFDLNENFVRIDD